MIAFPKEPKVQKLALGLPEIERVEIQVYADHIYVRKIAVLPLFQGQGIGSRILCELKKRGKPLRLIPYPDDPDRYQELIRFYERNGFHEDVGEVSMSYP